MHSTAAVRPNPIWKHPRDSHPQLYQETISKLHSVAAQNFAAFDALVDQSAAENLGSCSPEEQKKIREFAQDLKTDVRNARPLPPTPFEERIHPIASLAMNEPAKYRKTMEWELEMALAAHGGILANPAILDLIKKKMGLL